MSLMHGIQTKHGLPLTRLLTAVQTVYVWFSLTAANGVKLPAKKSKISLRGVKKEGLFVFLKYMTIQALMRLPDCKMLLITGLHCVI